MRGQRPTLSTTSAEVCLATGVSAPYRHIRPDAWLRSSRSLAARQRNFRSTTPWFASTTPSSALKPTSVLLFKSNSCLESREHCWLAAKTAASLAGAVPPCDVRADTV